MSGRNEPVPRSGLSRKKAVAICGSLSEPGKMPGHGYSLPAAECRLGRFLRNFPNAVCAHCYALRGRYVFGVVRRALAKRFNSLLHPLWVEAISNLIQRSGDRYFRWHDSGDIQSVEHLRNIVAVCKTLPNVKFWLPTREYQTVEAFRRSGDQIPPNLCVRYSAHFIDGVPPRRYGMPISTVSSRLDKVPVGAYRCKAASRGNMCGRCRACWDPRITVIDFPLKWPSANVGTAAGRLAGGGEIVP
jgi:hypothetical protein